MASNSFTPRETLYANAVQESSRLSITSIIPKDTILMAIDNIRANKFRSFLTVLGVVIGVVVVIVVASLLTGMRSSIVKYIEEYGTNNIYAFHLSTGIQAGPRDRSEWARKPLKLEDAQAILEQADAVEDVSAELFIWQIDRTLNYKGTTFKQGRLSGVSPNFATTSNISLSEGRFINEIDDQHRREVMVIGVDAAEALFPNRSRITGEKVMMAGSEFEIIGVLEKRKSGMFGESEEDGAIYIPLRTAQKLSPRSEFLFLMIRAKSGQIYTALDQVEGILRKQRGVKYNDPNNFDLNTADRIIQQFDNITQVVGLIAIAISSVGLLVGGIGVMNIMLVSVTERTAEIGVRKAIGARRGDIVWQFLLEAMTLTFFGGIVGVVLAVIVSQIIIVIFPTLPASIPLWAVVAGMVVSVLVGLIFGVLPARKASRLDPIECLRYE
ncbi:MAG: ABC transporter permease [Acidobacteriota bacterium]